jgi:outer membrane receptor protein involved in Fe transport
MPQTAGTFAVNLFYNYWFFSLYLNGATNNYIEITPFRRLASNYENSPDHAGIVLTNPDDMEIYHLLTGQEKFAPVATIDLSIGKIYYLKNRRAINFNLSLNNLLNKQDIRVGGFESGRLDLNYPDRYRSKYYYARGINFYFSAGYRF